MYVVNTNGNVVTVTVTHGTTVMALTMSLQRHHFNFCGAANALEMNSLMFSIIPQAAWELDAANVGKAIERHLVAKKRMDRLFDLRVQAASGREYLVDNPGRVAANPVNHFYPVAGTSLWAQMTQQQYQVARALRRIQEAIEARQAAGEAANRLAGYVNLQSLLDKRVSLVRDRVAQPHPVVDAYYQAALQWRDCAADAFRAQLDEVCNDRNLVGLVKDLVSRWLPAAPPGG